MEEAGKQFQFRLEDIIVSNFRIGHPSIEIEESRLGLEYGYNFTFNFEADLTNCLIHFKYVLDPNEDKSKQKILVHCDINYIYKVINLRELVNETENSFVMDTGLAANLLNVAFATSRGIIYERTRGYNVNNYILPVSTLDVIMKQNTFPKIPPSAPIVFDPPFVQSPSVFQETKP